MTMHLVRLTPALLGAALLFSEAAHAQAVATTKATRTYDCTKAGNANKSACKTAASAAKPATVPAAAAATVTRTSAARNYDCSRPGNANKAVCKTAAKSTPAAAAAPAAAAVAVAATRGTTVHSQQTSKATATNAAGPNGATAQCKDGTYSKSTHRSGTCAGHKGVLTWY